eukprot:3560595-Rhodomonas_salina.1
MPMPIMSMRLRLAAAAAFQRAPEGEVEAAAAAPHSVACVDLCSIRISNTVTCRPALYRQQPRQLPAQPLSLCPALSLPTGIHHPPRTLAALPPLPVNKSSRAAL